MGFNELVNAIPQDYAVLFMLLFGIGLVLILGIRAYRELKNKVSE
jgi:hypothetical protein